MDSVETHKTTPTRHRPRNRKGAKKRGRRVRCCCPEKVHVTVEEEAIDRVVDEPRACSEMQ